MKIIFKFIIKLTEEPATDDPGLTDGEDEDNDAGLTDGEDDDDGEDQNSLNSGQLYYVVLKVLS